MRGSLPVLGVLAVAFCGVGIPAPDGSLGTAQYGLQQQQVSVGNILIASEKLADPNFAQSVILIVEYDEHGTVGLIVNRRGDIPLSRIFPKAKHASSDSAYMGGPVAITAGQALLRLPEKADQATHIVADVYLTGAKELIEKSITSGLDSSKFRLYLGYAGWASGQLEAEIQLGAWSVRNGTPKIVFDGDPDSLWSRMTHESHMQIASAAGITHAR